jgi:hypothetical protein
MSVTEMDECSCPACGVELFEDCCIQCGEVYGDVR